MSVKDTAKRFYIRIIDGASQRYDDQIQPKEGWLATMRKALGMSCRPFGLPTCIPRLDCEEVHLCTDFQWATKIEKSRFLTSLFPKIHFVEFFAHAC